ncbi:SDR family NAD(P)-dependent oxidoreductase [Novosphingobium sp. 9U]|uniref:SDR family NAD(P)-dependent oxidoreductase n=1 Tax=Novosphingobium sp. 9U TaxID=2653158 RepID=UPI0012F2C64B|nr:SDR family oxidoreductase [Novosphingobium sp. 9U]VWX50586.1 2,5-dichloro-2,5-cyclohexadiene-1,4-diol dehydrogenase [Novosphingobium sp. 9U]
MLIDLSGRTVLVTGGGSGIGREACIAYAASGADVVVVDRHLAAAEETAALLRPDTDAIAVRADVTSEGDVSNMVAQAVSHFGKLDCAFNNAGVGVAEAGTSGKRLHELPRASWDMLIGVNLTGVWLCMKAELEHMVARGQGGVIVNNASIAGLIGFPKASNAYGAAKHGVVGMTRQSAFEYAPDNIRINVICPGPIMTALTAAHATPEVVGSGVPLGRPGSPEDIASMAVYLSSDQAAFITGMAFAVDGGVTAGQLASA